MDIIHYPVSKEGTRNTKHYMNHAVLQYIWGILRACWSVILPWHVVLPCFLYIIPSNMGWSTGETLQSSTVFLHAIMIHKAWFYIICHFIFPNDILIDSCMEALFFVHSHRQFGCKFDTVKMDFLPIFLVFIYAYHYTWLPKFYQVLSNLIMTLLPHAYTHHQERSINHTKSWANNTI